MNRPEHPPVADNTPTHWPFSRQWVKNLLASDFFKKVAETLSTRILLIIIGLSTSIIVARSLGPEGRGMFAVAITIGALGIQFANMGLHASNTFYVSRDRSHLSKLMGNSLLVSFTLGGLIAVALGLFFTLYPAFAPIQGTLLYMALLWTPFGLAYLLMQNLMLGINQVRDYNKIELTSKVFYVSLIGLVILTHHVTPLNIFTGAFVALLFSLALAYRALKPAMTRPISLSLPHLKESFNYGIKSYLGSMATFLLFRVDLLMINHMRSTREAGLYDIAINLAEMAYLLSDAVATILFPRLCAIKDVSQKWDTAKNVGSYLVMTMAVICIVAGLLAYPLILLLYGKPFLPSVTPFLILLLCKFLLSINTILSNFIGAVHVPWQAVPFGFFLVGFNIVLNLFFIESMGINGAAIASTLSFGMLLLFNAYYSYKYVLTARSERAA